MLARRFTVVCLLCGLFAVAFAKLVAQQAGRRFDPGGFAGGLVVPCRTNQGIACTPLAMRGDLPVRRFR